MCPVDMLGMPSGKKEQSVSTSFSWVRGGGRETKENGAASDLTGEF